MATTAPRRMPSHLRAEFLGEPEPRKPIVWFRRTLGRPGRAYASIGVQKGQGLYLTTTAGELLRSLVPGKEHIALDIGYDPNEHRLLIKPRENGQFRVCVRGQGRQGSVKIGGRSLARAILGQGVQPGRYPVEVIDGGMLAVDLTRPIQR